jgi:hypothetical protein
MALGRISLDRVWRHLRWLGEHASTRISGTPDQVRAGEYLAEQLEGYGLDTHLDTFTGYRSVPQEARLDVVGQDSASFPAEACGHIVSTPDEGLELDLVYVRGGAPHEYEARDVEGAAVLAEIDSGPSRPVKALIAAERGARAIVFVNWGLPEFGTIPCGAIKCAWGNPTRASMADVPQIAALGISRAAGDELIGRLAHGSVRARVVARATRDWGPLTQPWARLKAPSNTTGHFLLVGGHYDAWRPGMTDNGGGNALMLELARVFAENRDQIRRDVVFAFWNGHEVGDYEGSTWFADRYWDDLDRDAIAYLNVDSIGFAHTSHYLADSTPELEGFHRRVERQILGVETGHRHLTRENEHPFFGIGLPALEGRYHFSEEQVQAWGGARGGWWWHSTEDTLDKLDRDRFLAHARVYGAYAWELCTSRVLPMDFRPFASRIEACVHEMRTRAPDRFELTLPVEPFARAADRVHRASRNDLDDQAVQRLNRGLMRISRRLLPAFETWGGRYAQDRVGHEALSSPIPALHDLELLARTDPEDELGHLLHTELLRARNRLSDALREATGEALASIP